MLKKTITFEDLDGNLVTDDFYFHLSKAEIAEIAAASDDVRSFLDFIERGERPLLR